MILYGYQPDVLVYMYSKKNLLKILQTVTGVLRYTLQSLGSIGMASHGTAPASGINSAVERCSGTRVRVENRCKY